MLLGYGVALAAAAWGTEIWVCRWSPTSPTVSACSATDERANRQWKRGFPALLYRNGNVIECICCRLMDFRSIATRGDGWPETSSLLYIS